MKLETNRADRRLTRTKLKILKKGLQLKILKREKIQVSERITFQKFMNLKGFKVWWTCSKMRQLNKGLN